MSQPSAIDILVETLATVPDFDNPLNPVFEVLVQERPLTLQTIRQHTRLLHEHAEQMRDQTAAINKVIQSCKRISPTHLPLLPLGF